MCIWIVNRLGRVNSAIPLLLLVVIWKDPRTSSIPIRVTWVDRGRVLIGQGEEDLLDDGNRPYYYHYHHQPKLLTPHYHHHQHEDGWREGNDFSALLLHPLVSYFSGGKAVRVVLYIMIFRVYVLFFSLSPPSFFR